jgi:hypothetical protein
MLETLRTAVDKFPVIVGTSASTGYRQPPATVDKVTVKTFFEIQLEEQFLYG